jgi:ERCC4-related helicase
MKIILIALLISMITSESSNAYSVVQQNSKSAVCTKLLNGKGIDPFVDYLSGLQKSKTQALRSLDEWIDVLQSSYSTDPIVEKLIKKELKGIVLVRKRFLTGKIKTDDNAKPYIGNFYYLKKACSMKGSK